VVLVETGFPSRGAQFEPDYEFEVTPAGQQEFLQSLVDVVQQVPNDLGWGVFWWYPEARPVAGLSVWEGGRYGLFDQNGNLLPAISAFEELQADIPGDINGDGSVDAADYVLWRKTNGSVQDYHVWQSNFGSAIFRTATQIASVPEPLPVAALLLALFTNFCGRSRISSRHRAGRG
jgi:hypothetical protein